MKVMVEPVSITTRYREEEQELSESFCTTLNRTFSFRVIETVIKDICDSQGWEYTTISENVKTGEYGFTAQVNEPVKEPLEIDVDIDELLKLFARIDSVLPSEVWQEIQKHFAQISGKKIISTRHDLIKINGMRGMSITVTYDVGLRMYKTEYACERYALFDNTLCYVKGNGDTEVLCKVPIEVLL